MAYKILRQPRLTHGFRIPVGSSFQKDLERAVRREMQRWGVSRSFVIARAVAFALNVEEHPDYRKFTAADLKHGKLIKPGIWVKAK